MSVEEKTAIDAPDLEIEAAAPKLFR